MIRRSGTTLVEVLVAIFVTAIGLLGLLALFPLGAVNMAQAIKDSRCAQAAANAFALAEALDIRNGPLVRNDAPLVAAPDPFLDSGIVGAGNKPVLATDVPDGPSYPVYVDPFSGQTTLPSIPVGHFAQVGSIQRRIPKFLVTGTGEHANVNVGKGLAPAIQRFTLLDDINFAKDGPNTGLASQPLYREGRYSWAYLLRRPRYSDRSIVDVTVVVYSGRSLQFSSGEQAYGPVAFNPMTNVVSVYWGPGQANPQKPAIRNGSWILDATLAKEVPPGSGRFQPEPHGFFYRVVNVTEQPNNRLDLELQMNPRMSTITPTGNSLTPYGVLIVLDNVAEVFEKGPGWRP